MWYRKSTRQFYTLCPVNAFHFYCSLLTDSIYQLKTTAGTILKNTLLNQNKYTSSSLIYFYNKEMDNYSSSAFIKHKYKILTFYYCFCVKPAQNRMIGVWMFLLVQLLCVNEIKSINQSEDERGRRLMNEENLYPQKSSTKEWTQWSQRANLTENTCN